VLEKRHIRQLISLLASVCLVVAFAGITNVAAFSSSSKAPGFQPAPTADTGAAATAQALMDQLEQVNATRTAVAQLSVTPSSTPVVVPTATNTRTPPTATPRRTTPIAEVLVEGLNIRSGPGTTFPIVAKGALGQRFPVSGQSGNCAWLQIVLEDGSEGWISGAGAYSSLNVGCGSIPGASGSATLPTATPQPPTATPRAVTVAATPQQPTQPPAVSAGASTGTITSFEPLGSWRRGDEPYGTLSQSTTHVKDGNSSAALNYDFPAPAGSGNYVVFIAQPELRIPNAAQAITMQVYGDGSGHFLNAWVRDSGNQIWQLTFGRINHTGWAPMTAQLVASREWPNGPISGATSDQLAQPLSLRALVLDGAPDGVASKGVVYLDALTAGAGSGNAKSDDTALGDNTDNGDTPPPVAVPSGPLTGRIAFSRSNGRTIDTLVYDLATESIINQFPNWRQPDLAGGYLLVNGDGGGDETIIRASGNGGNMRPVSTNAEDAFPQFSPSLESMVYASTKVGDGKSRIYWQADASVQENTKPLLTSGKELIGDYPIYLDNWRIAYQGCNSWSGGSKCGIYAADTRGTTPVRATDNTSDIPSGNLGARVLFSSNRAGNWDVWIVNFEGSDLKQLTTDPAIDGLGVASPDGRSIAFVSNRGGVWAVWVMNTDGSNQRKLFDIGGTYGSGDYDWIRERLSWDQ